MKRFIFHLCFAFLTFGIPLLPLDSTPLSYEDGVAVLTSLHSQLRLQHGTFSDEYPEQLMAIRFIPTDARVLELGGNIGRNSCIIGKILDDSTNLVTFESSPIIAKQLRENRDLNNLHFFIENGAISKVPLIQNGWNTKPSDECPPGYFPVKIMSFDELQAKYSIEFNVLVADCEGALYQILKDEPGLLENIQLILVENDYHNDPFGTQYQFTKEMFEKNGFQLIYSEPGPRWATPLFPSTIDIFYQVWSKNQ